MKLDKFVKAVVALIGIQVIATGIFLYFAIKVNILPMKYLVSVVGVVLLLLGIFILIYYTSFKKYGNANNSKRAIATKLSSLLVSATLLFGAFYIARGDSFFDTISKKTNKSIYVVSVIVMKDSKAKKIKDLDGKKFGVCYKNDTETLTSAIAHFEEKVGVQKYTKVDDYVKLADSLYNGEVDAIIVGNEYQSMLEANHQNFDVETKVIEKYEITKVNKSTTVPTNVTEEPFTMYITGIDTYGDVSTVSRTDVNLLVTVNPKTKQILMLSIPRDTEVILHSKGEMDKLTHSGIYGYEETRDTIQDFLDVKINYYAKTNFSGIIDIVDALGGVTIDSPYEDFTTLHGEYVIHKGINEMDGDKALCFVRERYAEELIDGDFARGRNQQLLLKTLLDKAMSPKLITNFTHILSAIEGTFETDMSSDEIKSLINMQISDMSEWQVYNVQVAGEGYKTTKTYSMWGTDVYVMKPNEEVLKQIKGLIDKVEAGEKLTDNDVEGLE